MCRTVSEIAAGGLNKRFVGSYGGRNLYSGSSAAFDYRLWDADKLTSCICDAGYTGMDCSLRQCPTGADPLSAVAIMCGNAPCQKEVQGFTVSGADANDAKSYAIRFFDFNGNEYQTDDFTLSTSDAAANAAAVAAALMSLPNNVTGAVTAACSFDATAVETRLLVTFTDTPGNLPEFIVVPGTANPGSAPVAQPSQPVQVFTLGPFLLADAFTFTLYPIDSTGFRPAEFASAAGVVADTNATADVRIAISAALQSATSGSTALNYKHGASGAAVVAYPDDADTIVKITFPSKNFGAVAAQLTVGTTAYTGSLDTADGTYENSVCSDRGLCDATTGLCKCFPGYTGAACSTQNVLAM